MRKFYWYLLAYAKKHGWVFVLSLIGAAVLFSYIVPMVFTQIEKHKRSYIGVVGSYTLNNLPDDIANKISKGLTQISRDGSPEPLLASRWTVEQQGQAYRFLLKDKVFWHDGKEVKPEDINYQFKDVETILTPTDVVFKLPSPFAALPSMVAKPIFREGKLTQFFFLKKPTLLGVGEYKIVDYDTKGNRLTKLVIENQTQKLIYKFYMTEDDAVTAFKSGEIDELPDLSKTYDIMLWPRVKTVPSLKYDQYLGLFFNQRQDIFAKNIRQALSYATPKPTDNTRANGPISPLSWAYFPGGKTYDFDLNRAVERIFEEPPRLPLNFKLTTTPQFSAQAEQIKKEWETLGELAFQTCSKDSKITDKTVCENARIKVEILINNFPDTSDFQILLIGQTIPTDPDQYAMWHSGESTNFTGYKNTRIDALLEKGRQSYDLQTRRETYQEFQQFLLEDAPAVFINYLSSYQVIRI